MRAWKPLCSPTSLALLFFVVHASLFSAHASSLARASEDYDRANEKCEAAGAAGPHAYCLYDEEKRAGAKLTLEYQAALRRLSPSSQDRLRNAQRGWLQYQEGQCLLEAESIRYEGDMFSNLARAQCLLRTTLARLYEFLPPTASTDAPTFVPEGVVGFRTPSNNIHCQLEGRALRCDINEIEGRLPARPSWCDADWGLTFGIEAGGVQGQRLCAGDTVRDSNLPILAYGSVWRQSGFTCESQSNGLTCWNEARHGFNLSRAKQQLF